MFKLLRSRAKFFYWIIAVTFVLFTFIVWGAQCNRNPQVSGNAPRILGSIDGMEITWAEWDYELKQFMAQMRQQYRGRDLTANQRAQAAENVWQQMLRGKLALREIERRGLELKDHEVLDILKNDPPQALLAQYADEEGNVNLDAYFADLANPERDWTSVESYIRATVPYQRLNEELAAEVTVTEEELREEFHLQNGQALAEFIGVNIGGLEVDQPDDARISTYYSEHLDEYQEPERMVVETISLAKEASEADAAEVELLARDVRQEILSGELDFIEAAAIYSDDSTKDSGGDLGTFDRNRMVDPFTEVAFSLETGELSEPVRTQFGYHLIEVLEQIEADGEVNEVHARHILFNIDPSDETLVDLYERAERFVEDARDIGFTEAAADAGIEPGISDAVKEGWDLPGLRDTMTGTKFAFAADPGAVSHVFENTDIFYVVHVIDRLPEGPSALEDVRPRVITAINKERRVAMADSIMAPVLAALNAGTAMADVETGDGINYTVTDTFTLNGNVTGVGYNTDFNAAVRDNPVDTLIERVESNRGVFALRTLWKSEFDETAFAEQREALMARLMQSRQYEVVNQWFEDRIAESDIEDNRDYMYRGGN